MKKVLHHFYSDQGLFLFILFVGALLRLFNAYEIPFTHDELSALYRLRFDSFSSLIEGGVKVDGHPALIQVFLYYYTSLVGMSAFAIKLPFLVFGLGSIYLIYRIAQDWFNTTTALFSASFMATLQFPIMFSQIARPYISGLFFCLLLVYFWTQFLFKKSDTKYTLIGLVLSAALCSYNHYFSLMFAGIVGITGVFFLTKINRVHYVLALIISALLFVPHLPLFFFQFSGKGLDWLGVPSPLFITEHIAFIFHFNTWVYLLPIGIIAMGIFKRKAIRLNSFQWISLAWFILPIAIGTSYSILIKPVIQHSMLLFSFPFLILFLCSFIPNINARWKIIGILIICFVNTFTLIHSREHYFVFYNQPIAETHLFSLKAHQDYAPEIILNQNPNYLNFYFDTVNLPYQNIFNKTPSPSVFRQQLNGIKNPYLVSGNLPRNLQEIVKEYYPYLVAKKSGLNLFISLRAKKPSSNPIQELRLFSTSFNAQSIDTDWQPWLVPKSLNGDTIQVNAKTTYGPVWESSLGNKALNRFTDVRVSLKFKPLPSKNGLIVITTAYKNQDVMWMGVNLDDYVTENDTSWTSAYLSTSLTNAIQPHAELSDYQLKVYFWNKGQCAIQLSHFNIELVPGNPYEFASIQPIY